MIYKASPIFYEGHKIVRLSDLPGTQAQHFSGWIQKSSYVMLGNENDFDCVSYDEYEYWFTNYFVMAEEQYELI